MRATKLLSILLGLKQTRVVGFEFSESALIINVVASTRSAYCGSCFAAVRKVHDRRERDWRHLDFAGMCVELRYAIARVECPCCGVTTELVPWAEPGVGFTREFEEMTAYLTQRADRTTVAKMLRIAWATVGSIVTRVVARFQPGSRLDGLTHIGVDELSYRRHHEYVTVVVDHVLGRVVWAHPGKNADTLHAFFTELGPERASKLEAVTIDMSAAYIKAVTEASPNARLIFDRFHVQRLAHDALDQVRRDEVRELKGTEDAAILKNTRFDLHRNPWNLTKLGVERVAHVQKTNQPLYRAYLLKESLAGILDGKQINVARAKLGEWIAWATRSQLAPFQKLAGPVKKHAEGILGYVATGFSNGRTEGLNGKIRTITRRAYGFHDVSNLIGLIFLCCSGIVLAPVHKTPITLPSKC